MITAGAQTAEILFSIAAIIAVLATGFVIFSRNVVHGLLGLILALLAVAVMIFLLGAPFAAALEVIVYAGAIMVLFIFAIMMLGLGPERDERELKWLKTASWWSSAIVGVLFVAGVALTISPLPGTAGAATSPQQIGLALFGPYLVATFLVSMLLLSGLIGAYHLGRRGGPSTPKGRAP